MATVNIGNIKLNWKGAYNGSTAYAIDDVVSYNGSSYVCIQASTGNLPTVTAYWEQMSQKGTDADLINITGTVQGDLYYNNGGAIARLGAGTSGQVLQTGGTGANPSWGTVSSDYVKLGESGAVSNVASVNLNGFFTSDYKIYKVFAYGVYGVSTANGFSWKANTTGSYTTQSTSDYIYANDGLYKTNSTHSANSNQGWNDANGCRIGWSGGGSDYENAFEITFVEPQSTTEFKKAFFTQTGWDGSGSYISMSGGGEWRSKTAMTGIHFYSYSGNMYANNFIIYGIKS